jgi:hypothetical protein
MSDIPDYIFRKKTISPDECSHLRVEQEVVRVQNGEKRVEFICQVCGHRLKPGGWIYRESSSGVQDYSERWVIY